MDEIAREKVERLFDAFNRRDETTIVELCDERMEFFAVTAGEAGRSAPYSGREGLGLYLEDVARIWEELLVTPKEVEQSGNAIFVRGRVYLRSRALGIRDMPTAWIWELDGGLFVRGRVFIDPEEAVEVFSREERSGPSPDPGESISMTRLR